MNFVVMGCNLGKRRVLLSETQIPEQAIQFINYTNSSCNLWIVRPGFTGMGRGSSPNAGVENSPLLRNTLLNSRIELAGDSPRRQ